MKDPEPDPYLLRTDPYFGFSTEKVVAVSDRISSTPADLIGWLSWSWLSDWIQPVLRRKCEGFSLKFEILIEKKPRTFTQTKPRVSFSSCAFNVHCCGSKISDFWGIWSTKIYLKIVLNSNFCKMQYISFVINHHHEGLPSDRRDSQVYSLFLFWVFRFAGFIV